MKQKRAFTIILSAIILLSAAGCSSKEENSKETSLSILSADNIETFNSNLDQDVEDTVSSLTAEYEQLIEEINTYDKYIDNTSKIQDFYNKICDTNAAMCVRMREYALLYANLIMNSDTSSADKYDNIEGIYDDVYNDALDDIYDNIYDELLDDLYDTYYDGLLDDAYDTAPYREVSDAQSDEYDMLSDTRHDVYDDISDCRSDVYDFYTDIRKQLWKNNTEKAQKKIDDFQKDIESLKNKSN